MRPLPPSKTLTNKSHHQHGAHPHPYHCSWDPSTATVHGGERESKPRVSDSLTTPIVQSSAYTFRNTAELIEYQEGRHAENNYGRYGYAYGRYGNPTTRVCEKKIAELEGAEDCLVSSSGMSSITTALLALVPSGGHIVTTTDCYRRTRQYLETILPRLGIGVTIIEPSDLIGLQRALDQNKSVTMFFSESPTNPYLRCIDMPAVAALCAPTGTLVVIDATFSTPINQKPISLGADLVIHSATKYLGGHNDVLGGALAGRRDLIATVRKMQDVLGCVLDPHSAYLLIRGMKTLDLRVRRQNETAMELALRLAKHPRIQMVHYPGLESHPDHAIAKSQMTGGFGGVVSFEVDGGMRETAAFIDGLRIPYIAPSLGGVESLIEQPAVISYWDQTPEKRVEYGIKDNLVRFSAGVEDLEDLWADFEQALQRLTEI